MVDFSTYQPPGVFVEESPTPLVATLGLTTTIVALVGPSVGYRTFTEAVTLNGTTDSRLKKLGIDDSTIVVQGTDATLYESSDWTATEGAGADSNLGATQDNTMDLKRSGGSTIPDGTTVVVSYHYTDADYFTPQLVQEYETVKDLFGEPFDATSGDIISPISLAAKVAFENGAVRMYLVATVTPVTRSALQDAYNKLLPYPEINVIVPLPVGITGSEGSPGDIINLASDLKTHCESLAASDKIYRLGLISFETSVTVDPKTAASTVASRRVVLCYPFRYLYFNGLKNQTLEVGGFYVAAGYAGRLANLSFQEPLTRKVLNSFTGIPSAVVATMTAAAKNAMGEKGVAVTERTRDNRLAMRHGVTSDTTNVFTREISLVRARDALIDQASRTFDQQGIIGSPIDDETPAKLKAMMMGILEAAVQSGLIFSYNDVVVRQRTDDPTVMEIRFQYKPSYPLNYVVITFSVNTTSGDVTVVA